MLHDMLPFVPEFLSDEPDSFLTSSRASGKDAMGWNVSHSLHLASGDSVVIGWLHWRSAGALALLVGWHTRRGPGVDRMLLYLPSFL